MPRKKVKDMPRKQQMAVKAAMAEKAAGKKSPAKNKSKAAKNLLKAVPNKAAYNKLSSEDKKGFDKAARKAGLPTKKSPTKMVSAKDNNAAIKEKKRKTRNKVKRVVQGIMTGGTSEVVRKLKGSAKKYMAQKTAKNAIKESMSETHQEKLKRGLKATKKLVKKKKPTGYDYENDDRGMDTNPIKLTKTKTSPALAKLSASCKAAAKRKFKVYPSAYANMWASKTQKKGKC